MQVSDQDILRQKPCTEILRDAFGDPTRFLARIFRTMMVALGVNAYITKPFTVETLTEKLNAVYQARTKKAA